MRPRFFVLPIAALVIVALCVWKMTRTYSDPMAIEAYPRRLPPLFEAPDQKNRVVRFERYLGRHRLLVVFYDATQGADRDPWLSQLADLGTELQSANIIVVGISSALPQQNRQALERMGNPPFILLTDVPGSGWPIHRAWGCWDEQRSRLRTAVFFVDRAGQVAYEGDYPRPEPDPWALVERLLED